MITIIGVGAIGSYVAVQLARLGLEFDCYDYDLIEPKNIHNQAYLPKHIGLWKVEGLKDLVSEINPNLICNYYNEKVTKEKAKELDLRGTVFLTVDSIKSRKEIAQHCTKTSAIIEARLGKKTGRVLSFHPHLHSKWSKTLFNEEDAFQDPSACTSEPDMGFVAQQLASLCVIAYKNMGTELEFNDLMYSVFNCEYEKYKWNRNKE